MDNQGRLPVVAVPALGEASYRNKSSVVMCSLPRQKGQWSR